MPESQPTVYRESAPPPEEVPAEPVPSGPPPSIVRSMILADMLYAAREAFDDNRLLLPSGDNAYDRYREVLQLDPGNEVALRGIRDIVLRYVQLADNAMGIGQYDNAAALLSRAATIDPGHEEIAAARQRLEEARKTRVERFALDPAGVRGQSAETAAKLGEIGRLLMRNEDVTFLISAPTDAQGRWMYGVMREAAGGMRLRGNIATGETPSVQLYYPSN